MIITQLYPTDSTIDVGSTQGQYQEELTLRAGSLPTSGGDFPTPYAYTLGYISYDNLPLVFKHNRVTVTQSGNDYKILAEEDTVPGNYPIGYTFTGDVYGNSTRSMIYPNELGNLIYEPYLASYQNYINNLHPEYSGYSRPYNIYPTLGFLYCVHDSENNYVYPPNSNGNPANFTISFSSNSLQELYDFLNGTGTKTITIPSYGNITINAEDFYEPVGVDYTSTTGYIITVYLNAYTFPQGVAINGSLSATVNPAITIMPTYDNDGENESYWMVGNGSTGLYQSGFGLVQYSDHIWHYMRNWVSPAQGVPTTGAHGEFMMEEVRQNRYLVNGNIVAYSSSYRIQLYAIYTLNDILKHFSLMYRVNLTNETLASYVNNKTYATDVTENNEFLAKLKTGDISDNTFKNSLRPWQYSDFQQNEFDPDEAIPPYEPPSPDIDDNTESGDKVPNQFGRSVGVTSNFITNYLMTEGQISKLGEVLWTSWADDTVTMDMVNNFYGKFHDATGSWNVSDALQFIVSCRLFPCSLATLVNTTQVTSIPIGTGAFALQCGTSSEPNFFIANEATAILNCGDIYIPKDYNDYRDFENTKITAYLPFCGSVELNPQDVVGKWLGCTYAIDLFDGSCKAFIYTLSGNDVGYEGAYYNVAIKQGQCGFLIPLSASQAGQVASRQKVDGYTDGALLYQAAAGLMESAMALGGYSDSNPVSGFNRFVTAGTASTTLAAQRLGRAGISAPSTSGGSGFTDFHQPASAYVQIRRSYYQEPLQYEHAMGFPTNAQRYDNLSQFTGFVICHNVDLSGFTCHEDERTEIKALLESGVYL